MRRLISLELRRTSLRTCRAAALIIGLAVLALLYLLASIPYWEPNSADLEILKDRASLTGIGALLLMCAFSVLCAVLGAKCVVEEYTGKGAVLLLSYPVRRRDILAAKLCLTAGFTVAASLLCGGAALGVFCLSECVFPLCSGSMAVREILRGLQSLVWASLLAGALGLIGLWFGFRGRSAVRSVVAAVLLATVACQVMSAALMAPAVWPALLALAAVPAALCAADLGRMVEKMEV